MGLARAGAGSAADSTPKTHRITWRWEPKKSGAARFAGPNRSTTAPTRLDAFGYPPVPSNPARAFGKSGQRGEVPARAGAPDADPLRVETVGRRVGPQIADGAFHVLDLCGKPIPGSQPVVDRRDHKAAAYEVRDLVRAAPFRLVAADPPAAVHVDRGRSPRPGRRRQGPQARNVSRCRSSASGSRLMRVSLAAGSASARGRGSPGAG